MSEPSYEMIDMTISFRLQHPTPKKTTGRHRVQAQGTQGRSHEMVPTEGMTFEHYFAYN